MSRKNKNEIQWQNGNAVFADTQLVETTHLPKVVAVLLAKEATKTTTFGLDYQDSFIV